MGIHEDDVTPLTILLAHHRDQYDTAVEEIEKPWHSPEERLAHAHNADHHATVLAAVTGDDPRRAR